MSERPSATESVRLPTADGAGAAGGKGSSVVSPGGGGRGLAPAHVSNCHGEPDHAEEVELVGDRMKKCRDRKGHQRDLCRGGKHANIPERRNPPAISLDPPGRTEAHEQKRQEQQQPRYS